MKLKIKVEKYETEELEVEFPFYRKHDLCSDYDDTIIYRKIISPHKEFSIKMSKDFDGDIKSVELEFERINMENNTSNLDYLLGKEQYALTQEEFNEIFYEVKEKFIDGYLREEF